MFMDAAPGQILSRPRAGDDPGVFYCPPRLTSRGFRSILFWKAPLNKGSFKPHVVEVSRGFPLERLTK